jgi:phosphate transport system substrate-binding protein
VRPRAGRHPVITRKLRTALAAPAVLVLGAGLAACGGQSDGATGDGGSGSGSGGTSGEVVVDGSSTVEPLTSAAGEVFKEDTPDVNVSVGTSGTGGGFEKFCQGQTDISDASRPIEDEEATACKKGAIEYTDLHVATDALTVVVSKDNDFVTCLTTDELKKIWEPRAEGKVTTWNQVNPTFPNEKIELYGPGTDSGTFDYFTDVINGEEGASRSDYNASEDDNVLVQGVAGSPNALGYFGYTYYEANSASLKAVEVDSGDGCVAPSAETAQDGTYAPLSRPLFIYVNKASYADKPQVAAFVDFYVANIADVVKVAQFIPLNDEQTSKRTDKASSLAG